MPTPSASRANEPRPRIAGAGDPSTATSLDIGILGLWGMNVPGRTFGGFETAFSEIAPRLVARGHAVTIYCRRGEIDPALRVPEHRGVRLVYLPSPGGKNFSGLVSTLLAVLRVAVSRSHHVLLFVNVGMGFHCALARALGQRVALNVDGLDWMRSKWSRAGRLYFRMAARVAAWTVPRLVTDAEGMRRFYLERFGRDSTMIPYGADPRRPVDPSRVRTFGVEPGQYFLVVSRLIPENNLEVMLDGFARSRATRPLLVVGGSSYTDDFVARLRARASDRIRFAGHVSDDALLDELWCNAHAYLHGHAVGGTNPALLRAMAARSAIAAHDNVFNREVLGDAGIYFAPAADSVADAVSRLDADGPAIDALREAAARRVAERYDWNAVVEAYEALLRALATS